MLTLKKKSKGHNLETKKEGTIIPVREMSSWLNTYPYKIAWRYPEVEWLLSYGAHKNVEGWTDSQRHTIIVRLFVLKQAYKKYAILDLIWYIIWISFFFNLETSKNKYKYMR